jgi:hypothetical protein
MFLVWTTPAGKLLVTPSVATLLPAEQLGIEACQDEKAKYGPLVVHPPLSEVVSHQVVAAAV